MISPVANFSYESPAPIHKPPPSQPLDAKFRPVNPTEPTKFVLVTANNETYMTVNISEASTIEEVKIMIGNRLNIQDWSLCSFHLTGFGCKEGQSLDDTTFHQLIFNPGQLEFSTETLKIYVTYIPGYDPSLSPGSLSLEYVFAANTRQHSQGQPPLPPVQNPQWQHFRIPGYQTKVNRKTSKIRPQATEEADPLYDHKASMGSLFSRRTSEDSFKVIRPERREINFDDRRSSPYDRNPSYNPRQNSVLIQTGTLAKAAASASEQASKAPHASSRLERSPHLVAKRSAPPPPPGTNLQRTASSATDRSIKYEDSNLPETRLQSARQRITSRRNLNAGSTSKLVKQLPPRIDMDDIESPGLSEEIGFGFGFEEVTAVRKSLLQRSKTDRQDEKFHENKVSFEGAPALEDSDESSSDEGLWAKKPPKVDHKPDLHISTSVEKLDAQYSRSGSYLSDIKVGGWAVRPPAEVVYENLERFFPGADLDKPILFDPQGTSPPASPGNEQTIGRSRFPLSPVVEPSRNYRYLKGSSESLDNQLVQDSHSPVSMVPSSHFTQSSEGGSSASDVSVIQTLTKKPRPTGISSAGSTDITSFSMSVGKGRPMRPKSLRIVAREATERRNRFQSLAHESGSKSGALVRRKSTKMWGQRVVEVKPNDMKRGQISKLRDNRGEEKQFVWVKGELIGKGSFGKVYLALNATAREMIAVKQVEVPQTLSDKSSAKQKEIIDTLHSEVETMKDLDHFNIVQYLGFEALPDFYNLFLEYVPGGSVGSALRKHGRFEELVIKSLTAQVLDALAYLHSCGILHRDLKSDNLLIDLDGVCKISDFGISKKSRNIYANDAEMSMQGTIFWMAPEVIHNVVANAKQGYSAKVDIWSLGCVVLEMFAGRRPWSTDEAIGAMYKLGNARLAPPIPEDTIAFVSEYGKDFINECFTIDPEQRPTASELLGHPFCKIPQSFRFQDTQLAQMIRVNDKRIGARS